MPRKCEEPGCGARYLARGRCNRLIRKAGHDGGLWTG